MDYLFSLKFWESTPWLQQFAALLTIVAIPYAFIKLVIYKARHRVSFQPEETYQEATLLDHPSKPQSLWLQLMVKNKGFEISKRAEAYIAEIWKKEAGKAFVKVTDFRAPVKLKWSHEGKIEPIDILPRHSRRLDVCYICNGEKILRLMAETFPSGTIKNELEVGEYVFEIVVVSENSLRPARFLFNVQWDGYWKQIVGRNYLKSFILGGKPIRSFILYN